MFAIYLVATEMASTYLFLGGVGIQGVLLVELLIVFRVVLRLYLIILKSVDCVEDKDHQRYKSPYMVEYLLVVCINIKKCCCQNWTMREPILLFAPQQLFKTSI